MFIFASSQRGVHVVESSVGPCQFCSSPAAVDVVEYRTKTWWFGFIPTEEQVDRMAVCRQCKKSIKEVYYTMRGTSKMNEDPPMVEGKVTDS
jgi:hypothetical protein